MICIIDWSYLTLQYFTWSKRRKKNSKNWISFKLESIRTQRSDYVCPVNTFLLVCQSWKSRGEHTTQSESPHISTTVKIFQRGNLSIQAEYNLLTACLPVVLRSPNQMRCLSSGQVRASQPQSSTVPGERNCRTNMFVKIDHSYDVHMWPRVHVCSRLELCFSCVESRSA